MVPIELLRVCKKSPVINLYVRVVFPIEASPKIAPLKIYLYSTMNLFLNPF